MRFGVSKPMRVILIVSSSDYGGAESVVLQMSRELSASGVEVSIIYAGIGPMVARFRAAVTVAVQSAQGSVYRMDSVLRMAGIIRTMRPDVVHTHLWNADAIGGLAARIAGVPALLSTVHGSYYLPLPDAHGQDWGTRFRSATFRGIYCNFDAILAVSRSVKADMLTRPGLRVSPNRIRVLHSGISLPMSFHGGNSISGVSRIWVVANFYPNKGHELLLRALPFVVASIPGLKCHLVGEGPTRERIQALAEDLGIASHIVFEGSLASPFDKIGPNDVLALPSVSEGLPISILEALGRSIPVVASHVGGIPEIIEDGIGGLLFEPGDPKSLIGALMRALTDEDFRKRASIEGRRTVVEDFSSRLMGRRLLEIYREVLAARNDSFNL